MWSCISRRFSRSHDDAERRGDRWDWGLDGIERSDGWSGVFGDWGGVLDDWVFGMVGWTVVRVLSLQ